MLYAVDTNIIVYAHNIASSYHQKAKGFIERVMNERNTDGQLSVCFPAQVITEFINVMTWKHLEAPVSLHDAVQIVHHYLDAGITIISQKDTQIQTLLSLLDSVPSRKKYSMLRWLLH